MRSWRSGVAVEVTFLDQNRLSRRRPIRRTRHKNMPVRPPTQYRSA